MVRLSGYFFVLDLLVSQYGMNLNLTIYTGIFICIYSILIIIIIIYELDYKIVLFWLYVLIYILS